MALFGNILEKLGLGKKRSAPPPQSTSTGPRRSTPTAPSQGASAAPSRGTYTAAPPLTPSSPQPIGAVDVTAQLEKLAAASPQKLNWRSSIVDLLKLLGIDSSLAARKELAVELGCPTQLMSDSAQMNMWLHKAVLARIAENGGKVPQELLR
jgi:hypothetical protein